MSREWSLSFNPRNGLKVPDSVQSEGARLKELLVMHCRGPYDENGVKMRIDPVLEGKQGSPCRHTGIRTYPFSNNLLCAEIFVKREDWEAPRDSYKRFLWLNVDKAIWSCVEKLKKKKIAFDAHKLGQHLALVEAEFLGNVAKSANPDATTKTESMPVDVYPEDELYRVVVQYRIDGHGSRRDHDERVAVENLLGEFLEEADLGYCDGGDIGSGTMNVFCFVKPGQDVSKKIIELLQKNNQLEGATIAETVKGKEQVIWPPHFKGEFQLI